MDEKRLEQFRCRYEAMLTVLTARIACARDSEDWAIIEIQTSDLHRVAKMARMSFPQPEDAA